MWRGDVVHWPIPGEAGAVWRARPFGETLVDLEVDLRRETPPVATTAVLCACLSDGKDQSTAADVFSWTLNRRLQGLLAVTMATRGDRLIHTARCLGRDCSQPMDLPLSLSDFQRRDDPAEVSCTLGDGVTLTLGVPTGEDQIAWLRREISGEREPDAFVEDLLRRSDGPWTGIGSPQDLKAVEAALAEADPLTDLRIDTRCPECGAGNSFPLDLEQACLHMLAATQPRLLDEIHRLASAYHWSEGEIMAIPAARRRQYLARLDGEWS